MPNHDHVWEPGMTDQNIGGASAGGTGPKGPNTGMMSFTGGSESHSHDFTGSTSQSSTLPLYYALSYIMRII